MQYLKFSQIHIFFPQNYMIENHIMIHNRYYASIIRSPHSYITIIYNRVYVSVII